MAEESARSPDTFLAGLVPGLTVDGYRLEERIGAGGMAVVFRAHDERLRRTVALKVLGPTVADDAEFRERFIRESQAAARVDDPHIIPVYAAGESGSVLYIAMRYVAGGDLRGVLAREGPLPSGRAAELIMPVATALDAAHAAGLVHRDVKPANILVHTQPGLPDHVYLSDFGISKGALFTAGLTGSREFLGTPGYCASEQAAGTAVTGRTDQYALACVAFTLLTGKTLFERETPMAVLLAQLSAPPPTVTSLRTDLPQAVDRVLHKALAKDPDDRFESCGEFARDLREALNAAAVESAPARMARGHQDPVPAPPRRRRRVAAATATAAVLAAVGLIAALLVNQPAGHEPSLSRGHATAPADAGGTHPPTTSITPSGPAAFVTRLADPDGDSVGSVAFDADGKTLVTADHGGAYVWDIAARRLVGSIPGLGNPVAGDAFSSNGEVLATMSGGGGPLYNLWVENVAAPSPVATLDQVDCPCHLSPDGKILVSLDSTFTAAYLWNVATGTKIATLAEPDHVEVNTIAFSPDGKSLAMTADVDGGRMYLWDLANQTVTAVLTDEGSVVALSTAYSGDGATIANADMNGETYLWNVSARSLAGVLKDPGGGEVNLAVLSPDGKLLVTADNRGHNYLWNVATRQVIAPLVDPGGADVSSAEFSPDGKMLALGDNDDGGTYLWQVSAVR